MCTCSTFAKASFGMTIGRSSTAAARKIFRGKNPAEGTYVSYYLKTAADNVKIQVSNVLGTVVRELTAPGKSGINRIEWDLRGTPPPAQPRSLTTVGGGGTPITLGTRVGPGDYVVRLTVGGRTVQKPVHVIEDPNQ